VLGAGAATLAVAAPASAASMCEQYGSVKAGSYVIQNNRWGTDAEQCIETTSNGFKITRQDGVGNTSGAPVSYPSIFLGCHYGNCSNGSPLPAQVGKISSAPSSISLTYPSSGTYDAAYDIWLNADTDVSGVQDTEIMIWLNRQGQIQPIGSPTGTANIAGRSWQVWTGSNGANNVVSYLATSLPVTSLSFDVMDFVKDTFSRGSQYGNTSWYLTSIQAGFEPWIGGVGLAVNSFSSTVTTGGTTTPTTPPTNPTTPPTNPTTPPTGDKTCTATVKVVNSWSGGYQADVTVKAGASAITGWKATVAGATITQAWGSKASGNVLSNESWNGSLAAGASTTAGFIGSGTPPTSATCAAG
jgi:hypothetical protein